MDIRHVAVITSRRTEEYPEVLQAGPLDQRNNQIIDECENMKWDGGFYREIKGSHGREGANEKEVP